MFVSKYNEESIEENSKTICETKGSNLLQNPIQIIWIDGNNKEPRV